MDGYVASSFWCNLDSLKYAIEHNAGSVVILVAAIGFVFWRIPPVLFSLFNRITGMTRKLQAEADACSAKPAGDYQDRCFQNLENHIERLQQAVRWWWEFFLNLTAVTLIAVGGIIIYLVFSPPLSCAVSGSNGINVPAVFKPIYDKEGEQLFADERDKSFVRIWPGKVKASEETGATDFELLDRYTSKKSEAVRNASSKAFEVDVPPTAERRYYVLSWRDRDNYDVYFVSRLVSRDDGKLYIDSLEISSPAHGNTLMKLDYKLLLCSFITPTKSELPRMCQPT